MTNKKETIKLTAQLANSPSISSITASEFYLQETYPNLDIWALHNEIKQSIENIHNGDMKEMEAMLIGQAKTLQSMFVSLARRASKQEYTKQYTTYMNLALKTQAQSRSTIQALVELKYPRQVIVTQQANITQGNQQVNNKIANPEKKELLNQCAHTRTPVAKKTNEPNKLMNENHKHE